MTSDVLNSISIIAIAIAVILTSLAVRNITKRVRDLEKK
jgi:hypothetical protein